MLTAEQIIKALIDAHLSSQEETIFGDWLERFAIFINKKAYNGKKSGSKGIDLEFDKENIRYIIAIKSGANWGNSSQIAKMVDNFKTARRILRTSNSGINVVAINGCCYGQDNQPDKLDYFKYCGQKFWEFISGEKDFYIDIIEPFGYNAREKNDDFLLMYSKVINKFTNEFTSQFCFSDGSIDWSKIIRLSSEDKKSRNEL